MTTDFKERTLTFCLKQLNTTYSYQFIFSLISFWTRHTRNDLLHWLNCVCLTVFYYLTKHWWIVVLSWWNHSVLESSGHLVLLFVLLHCMIAYWGQTLLLQLVLWLSFGTVSFSAAGFQFLSVVEAWLRYFWALGFPFVNGWLWDIQDCTVIVDFLGGVAVFCLLLHGACLSTGIRRIGYLWRAPSL